MSPLDRPVPPAGEELHIPGGSLQPLLLTLGITTALLGVTISLVLLIAGLVLTVGVPMLPVVRGERETRRQILLYTLLLYAVTQLPFCAGGFGVPYLVASLALGGGFIALAARLWRSPSRRAALTLYLFSLAYLALLFSAMVLDARV